MLCRCDGNFLAGKRYVLGSVAATVVSSLESLETFRAHYGNVNSLYIFKTKASRGNETSQLF